jgi:phosphate transport system protein
MATKQLRVDFRKELGILAAAVQELGRASQGEVEQALTALLHDDRELARLVIDGDAAVNQMRFEIERACYELLATEAPVASDLRAIVATLSITSDLERIADHGKKIARTALRLSGIPLPGSVANVELLAHLALIMVVRALHALETRDLGEAHLVCQADDEVDALYRQTFDALLAAMRDNNLTVAAGTYLIQAAHELERVADRATNIAERVIYTVTGDLVELNV